MEINDWKVLHDPRALHIMIALLLQNASENFGGTEQHKKAFKPVAETFDRLDEMLDGTQKEALRAYEEAQAKLSARSEDYFYSKGFVQALTLGRLVAKQQGTLPNLTLEDLLASMEIKEDATSAN